MMTGAELFVRCLENEGVEVVFGIPGEENIGIMDALLDSSIRFVATRHEQGAAFMADVYGRLTGKAGVCLATLGPGATNLMTGVADANMDHSPVVAIAGQAATTRLHKESHQVLDLVNLFRPISKYASQILEPEIIAEVLRKAFKVAQAEKPGASFVDLPENIAGATVEGTTPLRVQSASPPEPPQHKIEQAAEILGAARFPLVLAGNGIIRDGSSDALLHFAECLNVPVATTFMAKGAIPFSHPLCLGVAGLQSSDYISCGLDRADVIVCVGYDMIEYHPYLWHHSPQQKIIHIDTEPAEVDEHYIVEVGVLGDIGAALRALATHTKPRRGRETEALRRAIVDDIAACAGDAAFPLKPQKLVWDLREALAPEDIVLSDVGAHKMWMARMYRTERPNTCIISNGFASMGIALPGALAAKLAFPERKVVAVTGDAGFLMNCQEIETAVRLGLRFVVLVWNDGSYGLIKWKQEIRFGRASHVDFTNPDFVRFAESFGARGYRVEAAGEFLPTLEAALDAPTVAIVDCPVDYRENLKLTERLGELVCPI